MTADLLEDERQHLACLLEAVQRCAYFLHASSSKLKWPLRDDWLNRHKKDADLFETLSAINERFAKLQDTLASAMRHTALLMSEPTESFLSVLVFFEKTGVIDSVESWQKSRTLRNAAAHDYETDYGLIAEHFNTLTALSDSLYQSSRRLLEAADKTLGIKPASLDFAGEFQRIFEGPTAAGQENE